MLNRGIVVTAARSQVGVRYQKDTYAPGLALDCVSLCLFAYTQGGAKLPTHIDYKQRALSIGPSTLHNILTDYGFTVTKTPRKGDLATWCYLGIPAHIGVISQVDPLWVIQSTNIYGEVTEHRVEGIWKNRFCGFYTYLGGDRSP